MSTESSRLTPRPTCGFAPSDHDASSCLGYERKCDSLNQKSLDAATRLGFTFEGTFRQAMVNKGRNRDTSWLSITDGEWAHLRPAFDTWLDPANFTADGTQRTPLSALTRAATTG